MARRFRQSSTPKENLHLFFVSIPWKLLFVLPIMLILGVPTFIYGTNIGGKILPSLTNMFYSLSNVSTAASPTPLPTFPTILPQVGPVQYQVANSDNCDAALIDKMHMYSASQVFSDANANTVTQLSKDIGQDCHKLQPGMIVKLSPQYPLVALSGVLLKSMGHQRFRFYPRL